MFLLVLAVVFLFWLMCVSGLILLLRVFFILSNQRFNRYGELPKAMDLHIVFFLNCGCEIPELFLKLSEGTRTSRYCLFSVIILTTPAWKDDLSSCVITHELQTFFPGSKVCQIVTFTSIKTIYSVFLFCHSFWISNRPKFRAVIFT